MFKTIDNEISDQEAMESIANWTDEPPLLLSLAWKAK